MTDTLKDAVPEREISCELFGATTSGEEEWRCRWAGRLAFLLAVFLLPLGCRDASAPSLAVTVRDSAGVRLVQHADLFDPDVESWTVEPEPLLRIGDGDGHDLYRVRGALLSDGELTIADGASREIRVFDFEGRLVRTMGGEGEGPGEFSSIGSIHRIHGDTLVAYDPPSQRLTTFGPGGELARTTPVEPVPDRDGEFGVVAVLHDGTPVLRTEAHGQDPQGTVRLETWLHTRSDGADHEIESLPGDEYHFNRPEARTLEFGPAPLGRELHVAAGEEDVYVLDSEHPLLRVYSSEGELRMVVRDEAPSRPLTPALTDRYLDERVEGREPPASERIREAIGGMIEREVVPSASDLLVTGDEETWIGAYRLLSTEPNVYVVLGPDGSLRRRVSLPPEADLLWAGSDRIVLLTTTPLDVEVLSVHELVRERAAS